MLSRLILPIFFTMLFIGLATLVYVRLKQWYSDRKSWKTIKITFWTSLILVAAGLAQMTLRSLDPPVNPSAVSNWFVGFTFAIMIGFILYGLILVIDGILGGMYSVTEKLRGRKPVYSPARRKFVQTSSAVIAGLPFLSLIEGITFGKYDYQVRKVALKFKDLPEAFHGFKIAQISDIHSGSFDNVNEVRRGVEMINQQRADMVTFTGDLVNSRSKEVVPFLDVFNKIKAPYGIFSSKGNHDYGIYYNWEDSKDFEKDQQDMDKYHQELGFDLLKNENRIIEKEGQYLSVVGVENWGRPPFPQYGDLDKALVGTEESPFTVLLSHDPSHWEEVVLDHKRHVHLTLSGHTHGMQFGVEIPGFKWSPVKYRYPRWAGLYKEKDQYLYVNRGFGFIGLPGRVGIRPEITVFELQKA